MLILAFETSAKAASVALLENDKLLGESYQNTGLTHSQTLMVMAEDLLKQCGKTVDDVTASEVRHDDHNCDRQYVESNDEHTVHCSAEATLCRSL